jgi:hypothetical protein
MNADMIKKYLVGLGFEVDNTSFRKFQDALQNTSGQAEKHASGMSKSFIKAGAGVVGAMSAIMATTYALLNSLAKADLGYTKLSMTMFMAKDQAKQFSIVTKTMGESIENIRWIPELQKQYKELMMTAKKMELPREYGENMKMFRSVEFEFTKLKVESVYGLQWIGHNIIKNLMEPIMGSKSSFAKFNEYLIENMPKIAKKIADVLSPIIGIIMDFGKAIWEAVKAIGDLWREMSSTDKTLLVAGLVAIGFYLAPITAGFISALAAASEFTAFFEGKQTLIPSEVLAGTLFLVNILVLGLQSVLAIIKSIATEASALLANAMTGITSIYQAVKTKSFYPLISGIASIKNVNEQKEKDLLAIWDKVAGLDKKNTDGRPQWQMAGLYGMLSDKTMKNVRMTGAEREERAAYWDKYKTEMPGKNGEVTSGKRSAGLRFAIPARSKQYGSAGTLTQEDAYGMALEISARSGVNPNFLFSQMMGESGQLKNYKGRFNLGNFAVPGSPEDTAFTDFGSKEEAIEYASNQFNKNWSEAKNARTPQEFAHILKTTGRIGGYYTASESDYGNMLMDPKNQYGGGNGTVNSGNTITININGAKSPQETGKEVKKVMTTHFGLRVPSMNL